jgi:hypothetical protein
MSGALKPPRIRLPALQQRVAGLVFGLKCAPAVYN